MKISYSWLKEYLPVNLSAEELATLLTHCGLEVENIEKYESVKGSLAGMVIGQVIEKSKHPDADRLSITKVNIGNGEPLQIVCGASNVAAGQKVVVATVGSVLYPVKGEKFEIKKSKIRGAVSEGMICAEDEIGLGTSHEGIMVLDEKAVVGSAAADYFKLESDVIFEIGLTPNRSDATSHIGVARDACAVINTKNFASGNSDRIQLHIPSTEAFKTDRSENKISVEVADTSACIRYSGIGISGVSVSESPEWLKKRLSAIGLKPINNIVDSTNFVLHETGQPMHAFDADKISGNKIIVKKATAGEKFVTLDGVERTLTGNELMICNAEKPMCMAGTMGGIDSGITSSTKSIFLESACFNPSDIRNASKQHQLKTDSSFRFERGTDPNATVDVLKRAALLIKEIAGGEISSEIIDIYPSMISPVKINLSYARLNSLTGISWEKNLVKEILNQLQISIESESDSGLTAVVPTFKTDVKREADLVEELIRIYGYDHIPLPQKINAPLPAKAELNLTGIENKLSGYLIANGFSEILNNSLTRSSYNEKFDKESTEPVSILNPLSNDLAIMRQTMLFGGLETIAHNSHRKNPDLRLFEFGKTYSREGKKFAEKSHLSILISGKRNEENWHKQQTPYSYYYLKSVAENCIQAVSGIAPGKYVYEEINAANQSFALSLRVNNKLVAHLGVVKKSVLSEFDISGDVYWADMDMEQLLALVPAKDKQVEEPPKFPEVRRDLSMMLNKEIRYAQIEQLAFQSEKKLLRRINLFDVYDGDKIEAGKKSYAMSFYLRDNERTLDDKQIDAVMDKLMHAFESKAGAVIRKA